MINNNTVPSAKKYLKEKGLSEVISESDLIEFTKLHLEAMKDEIKESFKDFLFYKYYIQEAANNYIKNNKL